MEKAMSEIELSPDQVRALEQLNEFVKTNEPLITLGGFAGCGKTLLISRFAGQLLDSEDIKIAFCAFTGKASSVLRSKLNAVGVVHDYCGTIHSLIYRPVKDAKGRIAEWERLGQLPYDLLIVDEASMVSQEVFDDLSSYDVPIIAVGDHGQLPPVRSDGFNLMSDPDIKLEHIHRQAADNPIVRVSMQARETGRIPVGEYGPGVRKVSDKALPFANNGAVLKDALVLCGTNRTRVVMNQFIRKTRGVSLSEPIVGDTVICLKNNRRAEIYNGLTGTVTRIKDGGVHWYDTDILMENGVEFSGRISKHQFGKYKPVYEVPGLDWKEIGDLFDYGYCLTTHKAQGSESDRVVVIEERIKKWDDATWKAWLYTSVTRAKKELLIIGN